MAVSVVSLGKNTLLVQADALLFDGSPVVLCPLSGIDDTGVPYDLTEGIEAGGPVASPLPGDIYFALNVDVSPQQISTGNPESAPVWGFIFPVWRSGLAGAWQLYSLVRATGNPATGFVTLRLSRLHSTTR